MEVVRYSTNYIPSKPVFELQTPKKEPVSKPQEQLCSTLECLNAAGRAFIGQNPDSKVFISNGIAKTQNGKNYTGIISFVDKEGNNWELEYEQGKLHASYKNDECFKQYQYKQSVPQRIKEVLTLPDGSFIYDDDFSDMNDIETCLIKGADNRVSYIFKNYSPKYKGEPVFKYMGYGAEGRRTFTSFEAEVGQTKEPFSSIEEAKEYFKSEYGINAEFINMKQAELLRIAIDEILELNYQNKGRKLFEGLKIGKKDFGDLCLGAFRPPLISAGAYIEPPSIYFNESTNYGTIEPLTEYNSAEKLISFSKVKGWFQHELLHYIHFLNSPEMFEYSYDKYECGEDDINTMKQVSRYSTENEFEFVAEYLTGKLQGKKYSQEVDELCRKFGAPDLF